MDPDSKAAPPLWEVSRTTVDIRMAAGQHAAARALHDRMCALRAAVVTAGDARLATWAGRIKRDEFRASAANLADWLALREADVTPLQTPLTEFGLSTLGRLEGHVRPSLDAVIAALAAISGAGPAAFPEPRAITTGAALLAGRSDAMFGADAADAPRTRIMVTLPTAAAEDAALVNRLVDEGADCMRINCAHDRPAIWAAMIGHVRRAAARTGRRVPVAMDLGGPKFRVAELIGDGTHRFVTGDRFAIAARKNGAAEGMVCAIVSHQALLDAMVEGAVVSIDDGKIWAKVTAVGDGHAVLTVERAPMKGARIKLEKGVNVPGQDLRVDALTEADLAALDFVVPNADIVSFSFVQTVENVRALIAAMRARANGAALPAVVLKIETPLAVRNLPDLIVEAGGTLPVGVMIARGDLAVEIGFERLSEIQEEILWLCEAAQVPAIWATQVLEGMIKEGQASRAEVTDAAMSQRAECVMLNKGPYIVEAVAFLNGVLSRMDRHQNKKRSRLDPLHSWRRGNRPPIG